jgi:hypothetical protein
VQALRRHQLKKFQATDDEDMSAAPNTAFFLSVCGHMLVVIWQQRVEAIHYSFFVFSVMAQSISQSKHTIVVFLRANLQNCS